MLRAKGMRLNLHAVSTSPPHGTCVQRGRELDSVLGEQGPGVFGGLHGGLLQQLLELLTSEGASPTATRQPLLTQ